MRCTFVLVLLGDNLIFLFPLNFQATICHSIISQEELVGIESRVEELSKLLHLGSDNDIRVVRISEMGGIGKTTLARALYERISHQYIFHSFVDDVSKIYQDSNALGVQKQFLSQSLNEKKFRDLQYI